MAADGLWDVKKELVALREELVEASEQRNWSLVQEIDDDIRLLLESVLPEVKQSELAGLIVELKQTYQAILTGCGVRRNELQEKMDGMRNKKGALKGYMDSVAAGNRELRAQA